MAHLKALISKERLPFTAVYFGSMIFVLWASLGVSTGPTLCLMVRAKRSGSLTNRTKTNNVVLHSQAQSYILTIIGTVIEILALLYYFTSYSPFSTGSIRLGSRMAGGLLPV